MNTTRERCISSANEKLKQIETISECVRCIYTYWWCMCDDKLARIMIEKAQNVFWLVLRKCEFKFKCKMSRLAGGVRRLLRLDYVEWPIMHFIINLRASLGSDNTPLWDFVIAPVRFSVWFRLQSIWWWSWWNTHFEVSKFHFLPEEWVLESYIYVPQRADSRFAGILWQHMSVQVPGRKRKYKICNIVLHTPFAQILLLFEFGPMKCKRWTQISQENRAVLSSVLKTHSHIYTHTKKCVCV